MFKFVHKILERCKEKGVDLLVARDMLIFEDSENCNNYKEAERIIHDYYTTISVLYSQNNLDAIKIICEYLEKGDKEALAEYIEILNKINE